jgi:hypothetical protein
MRAALSFSLSWAEECRGRYGPGHPAREGLKRRQINESHGAVELIPEGQPDGGDIRAIHDYVCLVPKDIGGFTERAISTIVRCTRGIGSGAVRMARDDLRPTLGPELEKIQLAACIVRKVVRWFEQAGTGLKLPYMEVDVGPQAAGRRRQLPAEALQPIVRVCWLWLVYVFFMLFVLLFLAGKGGV